MEENWKDYYHKGLAAFLTVAMCILFFFLIFRFDQIRTYAKMIMKILRPFAFKPRPASRLHIACATIQD